MNARTLAGMVQTKHTHTHTETHYSIHTLLYTFACAHIPRHKILRNNAKLNEVDILCKCLQGQKNMFVVKGNKALTQLS